MSEKNYMLNVKEYERYVHISRVMREISGISRRQLAQEFGVTEETLQKYENDKNKKPNFELMVKYLFKFGHLAPDLKEIINRTIYSFV